MRFALIGAAGYIAPRHMDAIRHVGGELVSACDTHDSVGVLDSYAPSCRFTTNQDEFFGSLDDVDTCVVCTPNCLHVIHALRALEAGCNVILEKPTAVRGTGPSSAEVLVERAKDYTGTVYPVVQLRSQPDIAALRDEVRSTREMYHVEIDYATYRGPWYAASWKGRQDQSGGLLVNLGIHLIDLCLYVFGPFIHSTKAKIAEDEASGMFRCERATVRWRLSTRDMETRRVFRVAGREIDLSNGMRELHRTMYHDVVRGVGWDLPDTAHALHAIDAIKAVASDV
jgi:UDP-N-acetyl-2-amino-2-deoxyglucuronate dehydrogenase